MNATERWLAAFESLGAEIKRLKSELAQRLPTRYTRQYKDIAGNPVTLEWLVKNEPEWAANQIRHRDNLQAEVERLNSMLERARDVLGRVFVACGCSPVDATADWYEEMLLTLSDETVEPLLKEIELARLRAIVEKRPYDGGAV